MWGFHCFGFRVIRRRPCSFFVKVLSLPAFLSGRPQQVKSRRSEVLHLFMCESLAESWFSRTEVQTLKQSSVFPSANPGNQRFLWTFLWWLNPRDVCDQKDLTVYVKHPTERQHKDYQERPGFSGLEGWCQPNTTPTWHAVQPWSDIYRKTAAMEVGSVLPSCL